MKTAMRKALRIVAPFILLAFASDGAATAAGPAEKQAPSVLILNSYHQGYEWSDREIEGILQGLESGHPGVAPAIEHLDLKRFPDRDHELRVTNFLAEKYRGRETDLAIVLDNPALDLVLRDRDRILPGIPVVFAGINDFKTDMLAGRGGITGIAEVQDHQGTLALALGLHPEARRILAVHDHTASGLAVQREMEVVLQAFRNRIQVSFNGPATYEEMETQIAALPPDTLVLILSFATDRAGRSLGPQASTERLCVRSSVPVYAMHATRLGHGIVGGMLIEGAEHGRRAAALALRVLAGEDPSAIPVEMRSSSLPMFDHRQMVRFGISTADLPPGSVVIHQPVSFYAQHTTLVWSVGAVLSALLGLIGCQLILLQRKNQAEHALQTQRDMLAAIFESAPYIVMLVDRDVRIERINRQGAQSLGLRPEDLEGLPCGEAIGCTNRRAGAGCGLNRPCADCTLRRQVQRTFGCGETIMNAEGQLQIEGGPQARRLNVLVSTTRVRINEEDRVLAIIADISELRHAEEALRASEANLRRLVENAPDAIYVQAGGRICYANPAAARLFGAAAAEDLAGRTMLDLVHPSSRDSVTERMLALDAKQSVAIASQVYLRLDRTSVDVQSAAVPFFYEGEDAALIFARDITERKKLEEQLAQAQKMEAIGTLAGGIAHDFNNVLGVIIGNSELLDMSNTLDPSSAGGVRQIMAAAQRAKLLVRQILEFSRHGQQNKITINLKPIVKETIGFLRSSLPATIQLQHYVDPGVGQILADPTQMQQVLMNLCANASHAMEENGGVLDVDLRNAAPKGEDAQPEGEAAPGNYVRLTVTDTGHGIDPAILPRIFEPYFTTKDPGKGTGLGLAVVHGIVKSHAGAINVHSEVGRGTTFRIYLPRTAGEAKTEAIACNPPPGGGERILFVDDEPPIAELGRMMLGHLGYRVDIRTSPVEALEAFRADPDRYRLVITDLTMPQMTGLKFARSILQIRPGTPVILCSGFSEPASAEKAGSLGIRDVLTKPVTIQDFSAAVRKALDAPC